MSLSNLLNRQPSYFNQLQLGTVNNVSNVQSININFNGQTIGAYFIGYKIGNTPMVQYNIIPIAQSFTPTNGVIGTFTLSNSDLSFIPVSFYTQFSVPSQASLSGGSSNTISVTVSINGLNCTLGVTNPTLGGNGPFPSGTSVALPSIIYGTYYAAN